MSPYLFCSNKVLASYFLNIRDFKTKRRSKLQCFRSSLKLVLCSPHWKLEMRFKIYELLVYICTLISWWAVVAMPYNFFCSVVPRAKPCVASFFQPPQPELEYPVQRSPTSFFIPFQRILNHQSWSLLSGTFQMHLPWAQRRDHTFQARWGERQTASGWLSCCLAKEMLKSNASFTYIPSRSARLLLLYRIHGVQRTLFARLG